MKVIWFEMKCEQCGKYYTDFLPGTKFCSRTCREMQVDKLGPIQHSLDFAIMKGPEPERENESH